MPLVRLTQIPKQRELLSGMEGRDRSLLFWGGYQGGRCLSPRWSSLSASWHGTLDILITPYLITNFPRYAIYVDSQSKYLNVT